MRDQWYGDKRDMVKWAALLHLAQRERLSAILQVALYRPNCAGQLRLADATIQAGRGVLRSRHRNRA